MHLIKIQHDSAELKRTDIAKPSPCICDCGDVN